jgi:hypothetical protein
VISAVRNGSEWGTNVSWPETNVFNDISNGALPAVSWVIPDAANSDHPAWGSDTGPSRVARETSASQINYISQTVDEFGRIVRFVEDTFNLGRLGTTDGTSTSISDMFDFTQSPRSFKKIGSKYSRAYFLHRKPSRLPVDTQ